jgi:alkanesulfonate monooxygenase SsuD/methylene tetrahydromethanopterin reductase-like flavin-dependent oxidoreductase (luciferase family)
MKVGVLLPSRFEDPGEFLADARAMEAAGADSVWMEEGDGHDPMLLLAAIAAVTSQLRLGLITLNTPSPFGGGSGRGLKTLQHLSRERVITGGTERWQRVEVPADRNAWATTLQEAQREFDGVIVPLDPRLLDILRHPEDAIDRSDLQLAQG